MRGVKVVFFGSSDFVRPVLESLNRNFEVVAVISAPGPNQVKELAQKEKIPVFTPESLDAGFASKLGKYKAELFVVASYGKIIPQPILDLADRGALNIHPSLLPKYRGASPIPQAILDGEKVSGISIIQMDAQMDHGPIIYQEKIRLSEKDTFDSLSKKMFARAAAILPRLINQFIAGGVKLKPQDHQAATYTKLIKKEDGYFDIGNPPSLEQLDKKIRAYYPWPGAWTLWQGKTVKFLPGKMVQIEGKKATKLENFLNGYPNFLIKQL